MDRLTWKDGTYSSSSGSAGGIRLFGISYRTIRSDPSWLMRTELPGYQGKTWRSDDKDDLHAKAEKILAHWLEKVGG